MTCVGECLDYHLRTIYLEGCCKAVLAAPSLDCYFQQPVLTNDFCDSPTYRGHCSTLLWKRDLKLCDAWCGPSTINVNPSSSLGLLFALMSLSKYIFFFLSTTVKSASSFCTAGADCCFSADYPLIYKAINTKHEHQRCTFFIRFKLNWKPHENRPFVLGYSVWSSLRGHVIYLDQVITWTKKELPSNS